MAEGVPLHSLLPDKLDTLTEAARTRLCEDEQASAMNLAWSVVGDELKQALCSVLGDDLVQLLARAWASMPQVAGLADVIRDEKGKPQVVEIGAHEFSHELHPVVAVTIGSCPCAELAFTFAVSARVSGVRLKIRAGHVIAADLGELWASARLALQDIPVDTKGETRRIALSHAIEFDGPGIPIAGLAKDSAAAG